MLAHALGIQEVPCVTSIRTVTPISVRYPEPNDGGALRHLTLCRIEADDGTVGWGEAVTSWPDVCRATEAMIDGIAASSSSGATRSTTSTSGAAAGSGPWWYGNRGGISSFALSAVDIALWDLKGRLLGVPVTQLLGGAHHERLPAIASTHPQHREPRGRGRSPRPATSELGFGGCKFGLGKRGEARLGSEVERDVEFMRLLRERIGPEPLLMWDRGVNTLTWDAGFAVRLTNALEEHGLTWIEEPFEPSATRRLPPPAQPLLDARRLRRARVGRPGLPGLHRRRRRGRDRLRSRAGGGITGGRRVIELVEEADVWFNAHAWSSAIVTAASLPSR